MSDANGKNKRFIGVKVTKTLDKPFFEVSAHAIENTVNVARLLFTGEVKNRYTYVGRLAGYFSGSKYEWSLRICANYGEVAQVGMAGRMSLGDSGVWLWLRTKKTAPSRTA